MDGTLKSWAVPKGPSLRTAREAAGGGGRRPPVVSYAAFSGDIPAGNYGAGHVDIFDRGVWSCAGDPLGALAAGKIEFSLHGERLQAAGNSCARPRSGQASRNGC